MLNLILPLASLLLNDFLPHENVTPGIQGGVEFVDYLPSDGTVPHGGLFIRASLGYLGEETHVYPACGTVIWLPCPPPTQGWNGPWPGGTNTVPRTPPPFEFFIFWPPPPVTWIPTWGPPVIGPGLGPDPHGEAVPEPGSFILLGAGLFCVLFAGEMSRRYRYDV
jgi:hypothetical protein